MKKYFSILLAGSMLFCSGCADSTSHTEKEEEETAAYEYRLQDVVSFAADEEESVYVSFREQNEIQKLDSTGELLETYDFGKGEHSCLALYDGELFSFTYGDTGLQINEYNLSSEELTVHPMKDVENAYAMCVMEDAFYLIVENEENEYEEDQERYDEYDGYYSMGEQAVRISRDTYEMEVMDLPHVIKMTAKDEDTLVYHAYDSDGGYYFIEYDCREHTFGEKEYNNQLGYLLAFAVRGDQVIYNDSVELTLNVSDMAESSVKTSFDTDIFAMSGNDLQVIGSRCYVLNGLKSNIIRYDLDQAVKENAPIVCYSPDLYETSPYGCGYQMETVILDDDEFALSVLAGNSDYDICMMHTGSRFSGSIRDQGAFYPLNDVPGVQEYLDSCHDYIREAATNSDGAVWMIPILIEVPCVLYNEENCNEKGLSVNKVETYEDLLALADTAFAMEDCRDWYELFGYNGFRILNQYHANYGIVDGRANYDTELFRSLCETIKSVDWGKESYRNWMTSMGAVDMETYYDRFLFQTQSYNWYSQLDLVFNNLNAVAFPRLEEGREISSVVNCMYFCVNQNSENLEHTLDFISAYCRYMMSRDDTCMKQDQSEWFFPESRLTGDLYEICSNGTVYFEFPEDIFWEDYQLYLIDEMTLDTLITETERKINMYISE